MLQHAAALIVSARMCVSFSLLGIKHPMNESNLLCCKQGSHIVLGASRRQTICFCRLSRPAMPLIVMCGIPCSGKTTVTKKLAAYLEKETGKKVEVINEEALNLVKQDAYRGTSRAFQG